MAALTRYSPCFRRPAVSVPPGCFAPGSWAARTCQMPTATRRAMPTVRHLRRMVPSTEKGRETTGSTGLHGQELAQLRLALDGLQRADGIGTDRLHGVVARPARR